MVKDCSVVWVLWNQEAQIMNKLLNQSDCFRENCSRTGVAERDRDPNEKDVGSHVLSRRAETPDPRCGPVCCGLCLRAALMLHLVAVVLFLKMKACSWQAEMCSLCSWGCVIFHLNSCEVLCCTGMVDGCCDRPCWRGRLWCPRAPPER